MGEKSAIEWCESTWNPVRGCSLVSPGCQNCYAMKHAHRMSSGAYQGLTEIGPQGPRWNGEIRLIQEKLDDPLHWRKPRRVFVNSMSDLFHEDVPGAFIDQVFAVMALAPRHTFQLLTKRAERMRDYFTRPQTPPVGEIGYMWCYRVELLIRARVSGDSHGAVPEDGSAEDHATTTMMRNQSLPNVWLGVSVENQATAHERVPLLLQTPAAVRFLSCEPLLAPIELTRWIGCNHETRGADISWVICGGESGHRARFCDVRWVRSIVDQCKAAGVPCFVKQLGSRPLMWRGAMDAQLDICRFRTFFKDRKGGDPSEWPEDLRVREFPVIGEPS